MPICKICDGRFYEAQLFSDPPEPEEPCDCGAILWEIETVRDRIMRQLWRRAPWPLLALVWRRLLRWAGCV
jgi:hypothetical protein